MNDINSKKLRMLLWMVLMIGVCIPTFGQRPGEDIEYNEQYGTYDVTYWNEYDNSYYTVKLFPGDKIVPIISATVQSQGDSVWRYRYTVTNQNDAKREIAKIIFSVSKEIQHYQRPQFDRGNWFGRYISSRLGYNFPVVYWSHSPPTGGGKLGLLPGETLSGFGFDSTDPPGIVTAYSKSYWGYDGFPDEAGPQGRIGVMADSILRAHRHVPVTTIGPVEPPPPGNETDYAQRLLDMLDQAYDQAWIDSRGIYNSLHTKLEHVQQRLNQGRIRPARNQLNAFLNQVDAQRGNHLTEEAYALLYFNGQELLGRLE